MWVELVAERLRQRCDPAAGAILNPSQTAVTDIPGQVLISKDELRQWDASARAWLQTADTVMAREHIEFRHNLLLFKKAPFPETNKSLYENVTEAWIRAVIAIEHFCCGKRLQENDIGRAGLIAMSAWHLYPPLDLLKRPPMMVESIKTTEQSTAAISTGPVTSKATWMDSSEQGIEWPLTLSHFRSDGKQVSVVGNINERLSISDLHLVTFGGLLRLWGVDRSEDPEPVARWMVALWECVDKVKQRQARPHWLKLLAGAASQLLGSSDKHSSHCRRLVDLGHRQGHLFLGVPSGKGALPWFGLRSRHLLSSLSEESPAECAIQYLREISSYGELGPDDALITWISPSSKVFTTHLYTSAIPRKQVEYRTATATGKSIPESLPELQPDVPLNKGKGKDLGEVTKEEFVSYKHSRWIGKGYVNGASLLQPEPESKKRRYNSYESSMRRTIDQFAFDVKRGYSDQEASERPRHDNSDYFASHDRPPLDAPGATASEKSKGENWYSLQSLIQFSGLVQGGYKQERGSGLLIPASGFIDTGLDSDGHRSGPLAYTSMLNSSQDFFRLWLAPIPPEKMSRFEEKVHGLRIGKPSSLLPLEESMDQLISGVNPSLLWQFFEGSDPYDPSDFAKPVLELMEAERHANDELLRPLRNITFATSLYSELDEATISPRIVTMSFANPSWGEMGIVPTRSQVFSCIAMMESGVDLKPEGMERVIGLSSGNSLFVLSRFLSDPGKHISKSAVTRLIGNIGRPGVSLLTVSDTTPSPCSRSSSDQDVRFRAFDGEWKDSFSTTSLRLSFTGGENPIGRGTDDDTQSQAFFVECAVSVHDGPKWVADLDVLSAFDNDLVSTLSRPRECGRCCEEERLDLAEEMRQKVTTADSWEEMLSVPPGLTIVRARGNVSARLAVASALASRMSTEAVGTTEELKGFVVLEVEGNDCSICIYRRLRQYVRRRAAQSLPFYAVV
jgi:hypothetical protein